MTPTMIRLSRPCYDKFHRCPGWAGGGIHSAKVDRCKGGYIGRDKNPYKSEHWKWMFHPCDKCNVYVLPYYTRWLDPGWWKWHKDVPVKLLAKLVFKIDSVVLDALDKIPGFSDAYEDAYNDYVRKDYKKIYQDN